MTSEVWKMDSLPFSEMLLLLSGDWECGCSVFFFDGLGGCEALVRW